jgi:hypothetical protein
MISTIKRGLLLVAVMTLMAAPAAMASSVSFYDVFGFQNKGSSQVFLLGNPSASLTSSGPTHYLNFGVKLSGMVPKGGDTMVITAIVMGSTLTQNIVFAPGVYPHGTPIIALFGFNMPKAAYHGVPVQMTMQLFGPNGQKLESRNMQFTYITPVPEPTSLALMGIGLVGISRTLMRRFGRV